MKMKELTAEEIQSNYDRLISLIETHFTGDKLNKIKKMINHFEDRIKLAPASSKEHFHGSHPGGYLEHCLNVYDIAMELDILWKKYSTDIDYTTDEIAFIALFHDIGKLGDIDEEFYQVQDNDWRRNTLGEIYKINPNVINMNGADRSLFLIQYFGINLTQNEWIVIKIHEGMYEDGNEVYLKTSFKDSILKSHLPHLIHHADIMSARIEYEQWKNRSDLVETKQKKIRQKPTQVDVLTDKFTETENTNSSDAMSAKFLELFNK